MTQEFSLENYVQEAGAYDALEAAKKNFNENAYNFQLREFLGNYIAGNPRLLRNLAPDGIHKTIHTGATRRNRERLVEQTNLGLETILGECTQGEGVEPGLIKYLTEDLDLGIPNLSEEHKKVLRSYKALQTKDTEYMRRELRALESDYIAETINYLSDNQEHVLVEFYKSLHQSLVQKFIEKYFEPKEIEVEGKKGLILVWKGASKAYVEGLFRGIEKEDQRAIEVAKLFLNTKGIKQSIVKT